MSILLIGRHGQVAQALQQQLGPQLVVLGSAELDLTRPEQIRERVRTIRPQLIINAAAHTAVDQAESEPELAFAINATGPGVLAEEAARLGVPLIHYSTDYVFDGEKASPYTEADPTHPLGVYGHSKLAGEEAIKSAGGEHLILRTSWVYSLHGRNFLLTMQRLLQERAELNVVSDQIGAPTWAAAIARSTAGLVERWQAGQAGAWGTYHLAARGETSWFGFAQAIASQLEAHAAKRGKLAKVAQLNPIPGSAYPTPARRPANSRLDCSRLAEQWHVRQADWHSALLECVAGQA